jgi:hypothetical protein
LFLPTGTPPWLHVGPNDYRRRLDLGKFLIFYIQPITPIVFRFILVTTTMKANNLQQVLDGEQQWVWSPNDILHVVWAQGMLLFSSLYIYSANLLLFYGLVRTTFFKESPTDL